MMWFSGCSVLRGLGPLEFYSNTDWSTRNGPEREIEMKPDPPPQSMCCCVFSKIFDEFEAETVTEMAVNECSLSLRHSLSTNHKVAGSGMVAQSVRAMVNKIDRYRLDSFHNPQHQTQSASAHRADAGNHSMADILEKEFDPKQSGERHQKEDDPFASTTVTATATATATAAAAVSPFGASSVSPRRQKRASPELNATASSPGFVGFESDSKMQSAASSVPTDNGFSSLPSFYAATSSPNSHRPLTQSSSSSMSPIVSSKPTPSAAPKRKVRSKGSIKKKAASRSAAKPMGSGFVGFGAAPPDGSGTATGGSAFGFSPNEDLFAGLSVGPQAVQQPMQQQPAPVQPQSAFDFMNRRESTQSQQPMFPGFGGSASSQSTATTAAKSGAAPHSANGSKQSDDPFAGLF